MLFVYFCFTGIMQQLLLLIHRCKSVHCSLLLLATVFYFIPDSARAQFQQFRHYNVSDGLPSSDVYDMIQDSSGYLWFTTDMGVSRFDGYEFRNFSNEHGLPDHSIFKVHQDKKGRIWFTSFSGRLSYYQNNRIHTLPCNDTLEQLIKGSIMTSLYIDEGDTIWAGTTRSFAIKINPGWKNNEVTRIPFPKPEGYLCLLDGKGYIFGNGMYAVNELTFYQRPGQKIKTLSLFTGETGFKGIRYAVQQLRNGNFIITANTKIICCNARGVLAEKTTGATGICILEEKEGKILTGTNLGIIGWADPSFREKTHLPNFDQKVVTAIFRDNENSMWVCTEGNGVFCITHEDFIYYTPADGLSESKITGVAVSGNKVITGHLDGTISILHGKSITPVITGKDKVFPGRASQVSTILGLNEKEVLVSTNNCLYTINTDAASAKAIDFIISKKMILSRDGNIWALRYSQLLKYNRSLQLVKPGIPLTVFTDNMYEDRSGVLWICSMSGLWTYTDSEGLRFRGTDNPLLASRIVAIQEDDAGNLWFVSRGNGVIIKKQNTYYHITKKNGLAGNMCRTLFIDSGNVAWVGTNNGLSRISFSFKNEFRYTIKTFCSQNGLLSNEVSNIFRLQHKLWVVHTNGISVFDPASLEKSTAPPPVYIVNTIVNDDTIAAGTTRFSYDQNYFNISFIGLSYKNPGQVSYRYKMEGVDSSWISTKYTSVKYQTLPPGHYRFLVAAKNNGGNWSKTPASFSFEILPAWWQSWIFKLAVLLFCLCIVFLVFKIRISNIRKREQQKTKLQNRIATFELNALRAQMNPHFVFNAINSVQYFITNNDPDSSQEYLSKFAKLIRYVVDNSRLTFIPIKKEIEALTLYLDLEALRFGTRFRYNIRIHPNVDMEYTQIPSMLIQPYVENAIWHGIMHKKGNGTIDVSLEMKGEILYCVIQDDGIGRQKSLELKKDKGPESRQSVGMSNTRDRLEIINQVNNSNMHVQLTDLFTESGEACGTKVEIHIPINYIS